MLKRQRPVSPPPSSLDSEYPITFPDRPIRPLPEREVSEPGSFSQHPRSKRRRVHAPVLDGPSRGWLPTGVNSTAFPNQDSDGEEDWVDEGDDESSSAQLAASPEEMAMYKQTNSILHEVHALHQHRMMFVNPGLHLQAISPPYPNLSSASMESQQTYYSQQLPSHAQSFGYPVSVTDHSGGKSPFPREQDHPIPYVVSVGQDRQSMSSWQSLSNQGSLTVKPEIDEVQIVRERYEDTNKLLGSLFLSRRRALEDNFPGETPGNASR
ncbi:hypothetical protein BJ138DRAFT_378652 [Hygrophoropsis aurantiaca]|uniref:Uncharacterized protein n=1 Tax=Hygrophoropsis aurantiaca TaxID=72124 RepID=A0ACB8A6H4_9AGAM|nr:hypothetical protein BJ138DRAFT_378652 [Hygrophoropsis aurantiaca]